MSIWHRRRLLNVGDGPTIADGLLTDLVYYHKLEDATQTIGGTTTETGTGTFETGIIGDGFSPNAGGDYLSVANASMGGLKFTGDFSACFWGKTDLSFNGNVAFAWYDGSGELGYWCIFENSLDRMYLAVSADGSTSQPDEYAEAVVSAVYGGSHDADQWIFVTCRYNSATNTASVSLDNGDNTGSDTKNNSGIHVSSSDFYIGTQGAPTSEWLGVLDEMGLWSRLITAEEEAYLYNEGAGRTHPFT